jgi:hypothetical protein
MAGFKKEAPKSLHSEFGWFIYGLLALIALWFFSGGAEREIARAGIYLKPLAPIDSGQAYGAKYIGEAPKKQSDLMLPDAPADVVRSAEEKFATFFEDAESASKIHGVSLLSKTLAIDGYAGAQITSPSREYIRIILPTNAEKSEILSGLVLRSGAFGISVEIPDGTVIPLLGVAYRTEPIVLRVGGRAIIATGRSPIGTSFEVNQCTGYLGQFQEYVPELRKDCPNPIDELKLSGPYSESSCRDFVDSIPRCTTSRTTPPSTLSSACRAFIVEKLTYNSCAARHQNDSDFLTGEWRIFLGRTEELWKNKQEIIRLMNAKGETLDAITY